MTPEAVFTLKVRLRPTLLAELRSIRERNGGADPRATLKSRFDSTGTIAAVTLNTLLGFDRTLVTPDEFSEMVAYAAEQL